MYPRRFSSSYPWTILVCLLIASFFSQAQSFAAQVVLAWDPSSDSSVTGYKIYYGTQSRNYTIVIDAGANLSYPVAGVSETQTGYFAVTAYSANAESDYSQELACYAIRIMQSSNGQIVPGDTVFLAGGSSQNFSIAPNPGYQIADVLIDDTSIGAVSSYSFSNASTNHKITAVFVPVALATYTISVGASTNGSISPSGSVSVQAGASKSFTIGPAAGYKISDVKVDGSSVGAVSSYTFSNVSANHSIAATFMPVTYTISATPPTSGSISPSGSVSVQAGASQTFTISPAAGYKISDVKVDGSSVGAVSSYTLANVTANHTISASFTPATYTISATPPTNGSISPSGSVSVQAGASKSFTIGPAAGYKISDVKVDGSSVGAVSSYTFSNVSANHSIAATFAQATYTISATPPTSGSISPSGSVSVQAGASKSFTISPAAGYKISDVKVDGSSVGAVSSYTFANVTANHTISASFTPATYTISVKPPTNGSIRPFGLFSLNAGAKGGAVSFSVQAGASQTFTISPANGYKVSDVEIDGFSVGTVSSYTFSNVSADHSIQARFTLIAGGPIADAGPNQVVKSGERVVLEGLNSTIPHGMLFHRWVQIGGPTVKIIGSPLLRANFTAPNVTTGVALTFRLDVLDNTKVMVSDTCIVNVAGTDEPPSSNAGIQQDVIPYSIVTLDGSRSYDPDDGIASYEWVQVSGVPVTLNNADTAHASFVAPEPGISGSTLCFRLTVVDYEGLMTEDHVLVNIIENYQPPAANAGGNKSLYSGNRLSLDASDSNDPTQSELSYRWKQTSGPPVTLSDPTAKSPSTPVYFTSETVNLEFMVTVTNAIGLSSMDKCVITVHPKSREKQARQ